MKLVARLKAMQAAGILVGGLFLSAAPGMQTAAFAQDYGQNQNYGQDYANQGRPSFSPEQLNNLVSRVALYPDPLLAQVLAAASFPDQIPDAARWANQNQNLRGNQLADAIYQSNLQFDPAVQALIPFPAVLDMMARDMNWTGQLGEAVLADQRSVMDAVQNMRQSANQYGYLQSNQQMRVVNSGYGIDIEPVDPSLIYVPVYDPYVVYAPPRPGFFVGGAIRLGYGYPIGAFSGWGWGGGFNWSNHSVFVNRAVWGRTWDNRAGYVHNYGNWDRGAWRNSYSNRSANRNVTVYNNRTVYQNENVNRNANRYDNSGREFSNGGGYRGAQSAPVAPIAPSPAANTYRNDTNRNNPYQNNTDQRDTNRNTNRDAYRNTYSNPGVYRGAQQAPAAAPSAPAIQNRTFERSAPVQQDRSSYRNTYSNPGMNRGAQQAPAAAPSPPAVQNRTFERSAPVQQDRNSGDNRGTGQGRMEHNGGGRR